MQETTHSPAGAELVFVYGTLRSNASNGHRMAGGRLIGKASFPGRLFRVSWYPAVIAGEDGCVQGEVFEVNQALLASLDAFEGLPVGSLEGDEYRREKVKVTLEDGRVLEAWSWLWIVGVEGLQEIVGGDWQNG